MDLSSRFNEVVTSEDQFRAVMGKASALVLRKEIPALDSHARAFIGRSPFVLLSTSDAVGCMDISPKGDPPGFVRILDDKTLAIPDRLGNRRADTFRNLLANDRIGLIFLVPGKQETLRMSGRAIIVRDESVREQMAVRGKLPEFAIVVGVEQMFFHCAKCMIRSGLWRQKTWPDLTDLPTLAETMVSAGKLDKPLHEMQSIIDKDVETRLY